MARDISELGADVFDDTPVDPKHKMSKKKRNYIIGLSIAGALVAGLTVGTVVLAKTALSDYSNVENITYYVTNTENGKRAVLYKLKSNVNYPSTFRIPSQIKGYKVIGVANNAFSGHREIKKIIMPNSLEYVGEKAFYNCTSLSSFSWSKNLNEVGVDAFLNTQFYTNLLKDTKSMFHLPSGLLIYVGTDYFQNGTALVSEKMKDATAESLASQYGITGIQHVEVFEKVGINNMCSGAFKNNNKIVFIDLPSHLTNISNSTFEGCKNLQGLVGTNSGVIEISQRAFADCTSLSHIEFPSDLVSIGKEAFSNTGLTDKIPDLSNVQTIGESVFSNCKALTSLTYNGDYVPDYTFSGCSNLSDIEWGVDDCNINNVKSFGIGAFSGTKFTSFTFPKNISYVADELFKDCSSLEKVSMYKGGDFEQRTPPATPDPEDPYDYLDYVDYDGNTIKNVVSSTGISSIRASAFQNCTALKTINLYDVDSTTGLYDENVTGNNVGTFNFPMTLLKTDVAMTISGNNNYTFSNSLVEKVRIMPNLRTIGSYAFYRCEHLSEVEFLYSDKSALENIKSNAFAYCTALEEITIPTSLQLLGPSVFMGCTNLETINVADLSIESFNSQIFAECESLEEIVIPATVESIKEHAFYHNYLLKSVYIDKNISEIHEKAFEEMRHEGEEAMPIFFNFTHEAALDEINYNEDKFCDNTCIVYYLLGEGETADPDLHYWHDVGGVPTPYNP